MQDLIGRLRSIAGDAHVVTDAKERAYFSMDAFWKGATAAAVVAPGSKAELVEVVKAATLAGRPVIARGGGMSYTAGYVPAREGSITLDTRRLDRIVLIDAEDMVVTAECGCSWQTLYEALRARGLRTPYFGPMSGRRATLGGTLSNNSMFYGSGLHGTAADSVVSLEVVLADGRLLRTGSRANRGGKAFHRPFGPDLTGLFLSDAGALGIKTEASLRLIPAPAATGFASFAFASFESLFSAQSAIARERLLAECFGFDPFLNANLATLQDAKTAVATAWKVARAGGSWFRRVKDLVGLARGGTSFLSGANWSLHLVCEGATRAEVEGRLARARALCRDGREISDSVPKVIRADPFRDPGEFLVGHDGERWIPIHACLPLSKVLPAHRATEEYFEGKRDVLERFSARTSLLTAVAGTDFIFEPAFYYPDALTPFQLRNVPAEAARRFASRPAVPGAREAVLGMLRDLARIYCDMGAVHQQLGKFYPYREALDPVNWELLSGIKDLLDPGGLVNPGTLGLGAGRLPE